jgi:hypothetical protein
VCHNPPPKNPITKSQTGSCPCPLSMSGHLTRDTVTVPDRCLEFDFFILTQ